MPTDDIFYLVYDPARQALVLQSLPDNWPALPDGARQPALLTLNTDGTYTLTATLQPNGPAPGPGPGPHGLVTA